MMIRIYGLNVRSRPAALALAAAALAGGAVFLAFGIVLLLGVAVVGTVVGTVVGAGALVYRSLTGRRTPHLPTGRDPDLDPSLEIFPDQRSTQPLPPPRTRPRGPEPD